MKSNYKTMVLSCIDPRFQPIVYKYLKKKKLVGQYSAFTIAGSSIGVTAKKFKRWHKVFWDNFNTSFNRIMKDYVSNIGVYDKKWLSKSSKMPAKDFKKHVNLIKKNIRLEND